MKLLRVMGCDSVQYTSIERSLVRLTERATARGHRSVIAYNSVPRVPEFIADVRRAGGEVVSLDLPPRASLSLAARKLGPLIRRERPDVLHANFTPLCHEALALGALFGIERRFRTSMNMPWSIRPEAAGGGDPGFTYRLRHRLLCRLPHRIVAMSGVMKAEYLRLGVPEERVVVIHSGVDTRHFTPENAAGRRRVRAEWGVREDERLVGFLGRLVPVKALDVLLDAAARVVPDNSRARFVLAGDGPLRALLEERARALGLAGRLHFAGHRTDTRDVLAAMDIVALCSVSEGLSNTLLEAMAMEKPIVASHIPPNAELVVDGETGLLVPLGDVAGFAAALRRLVADDATAAEMGRRARGRAEAHFSLDGQVEAELDLYEAN